MHVWKKQDKHMSDWSEMKSNKQSHVPDTIKVEIM